MSAFRNACILHAMVLCVSACGDDVSYERKIREMIVAARIDQSLSKDELLEVYLNSIFLGRGSWGIDMAAHTYRGRRTARAADGRDPVPAVPRGVRAGDAQPEPDPADEPVE